MCLIPFWNVSPFSFSKFGWNKLDTVMPLSQISLHWLEWWFNYVFFLYCHIQFRSWQQISMYQCHNVKIWLHCIASHQPHCKGFLKNWTDISCQGIKKKTFRAASRDVSCFRPIFGVTITALLTLPHHFAATAIATITTFLCYDHCVTKHFKGFWNLNITRIYKSTWQLPTIEIARRSGICYHCCNLQPWPHQILYHGFS